LRENCSAFLAQGGVDKLLLAASASREELYAPIAQVLHRAVADLGFDRSTTPKVVEFCSRVLVSEQAGVAQFLALQLLKEMYLFAPEIVAAVVSSPPVVKRVTALPWLLEALRFFFQA
jgi:hypothetical protein